VTTATPNFAVRENFSLAAKKEKFYSSPSPILRAAQDVSSKSLILRTSESFSASLLQTLGVILLCTLLLQPLAPWRSRPAPQNHTWEKTFPSSTSHLEKTTYDYDVVSGSSLYCNGDPVNGLDPDGRCVESTLNAVPGQAAWKQSVASFNNGDYGQATLSFGLMLSEQALTVATLGMGSAATTGASVTSAAVTETAAIEDTLFTNWNEFQVGTKGQFASRAEAGVAWTEYKTGNSTTYGPMNPGPLATDIMDTFRSGSYIARTLNQPTTLYRVIGENGNPLGRYWTSIKPQGPLQSIIDFALDQNWGNQATKIITAKIPAGVRIYEGPAASQGGLVGGGNQIYLPKVNLTWLNF